jgi:hypothetical protein
MHGARQWRELAPSMRCVQNALTRLWDDKMKSTDKTLDATIGTLTGNEARAIIRAALGLRRSVPINKAKNDVIRALQDGQRCGITKRSIAATRRTDTKNSAAGRKAIKTMRRKAGDAYLSGLEKKQLQSVANRKK